MRPIAKVVIVVFAVIAIALLIWSVVPWFNGSSGTRRLPASVSGPQVSVENARVVMPANAGAPAALYFDMSNRGGTDAVLRTATVEHATGANIMESDRPVNENALMIAVHPGETVHFSPAGPYVAVSGYDSSVVPGATLKVQFGFGNSGAIDTTAIVQSAVGQNGSVNTGSEPE